MEVTVMARKAKTIRGSKSNAASGVPVLGEALRERITAKAYELYLNRGQSDGHEVEDWLEAERQLAGNVQLDLE
jgi:hypothetical protein